MKFDQSSYRSLERAAKFHELRFDVVSAITQVESDWNPWHVRFDDRDKLPFKPDRFADDLSITIKTEMVLQLHRWGLMGIPGFLARQYGFKGPLQTLCGPDKNVDLGCLIFKDFQKKMDMEAYAISAWFFGETYTEKRIKNPGSVRKVLTTLQRLRGPAFE